MDLQSYKFTMMEQLGVDFAERNITKIFFLHSTGSMQAIVYFNSYFSQKFKQ